MKWVSETSTGPESVGFTFKDFDALYGGKFMFMDGGEEMLGRIEEMMEKPFSELSEEEEQFKPSVMESPSIEVVTLKSLSFESINS